MAEWGLAPRPWTRYVLVSLTVSVAAADLLIARQQTPTFRTSTNSVAIYATARDSSSGRLAPNLTRDQFEILDDGRPVEITVFSNAIQPITVVLMLDLSGSMWGKLALMRRAATAFVATLLPADRARIGSFSSSQIAISPTWTNDQAALQRVLREELWPGARSPVWNGIDAAMSALSDRQGRKVVLAVTDGDENGEAVPGFRARLGEVRARSEREGFMVYVIGPPGARLDSGAVRLAEDSGGGHFELAPDANLPQTFSQVADELHHQYLLGFVPATLDGKLHKLEVRARHPNVKVRAQVTYLARRPN